MASQRSKSAELTVGLCGGHHVLLHLLYGQQLLFVG